MAVKHHSLQMECSAVNHHRFQAGTDASSVVDNKCTRESVAAEVAEAVLACAFVQMAVVASAAVGTLFEVVVGCKLDLLAVLTLLQLIRYKTYQITLWINRVYIINARLSYRSHCYSNS